MKKRLRSTICGILLSGIASLLILTFSCKKNGTGGSTQTVTPTSTGGGQMVMDTGKYIGVNYNESLDEINYDELSQTNTKWVRGFLDVFLHYDNQDLNTNPRIVEYLKLKDRGYKTVLNLKFNFITRPYPAINSTDWSKYIGFIDQILSRVIGKTDVIVVGNEPFIESPISAWNEPLNSFYKAAAARVNQYFISQNINKPIFVGSFDNLYQSDHQGVAGIDNLMAWCKATPWIAGIDLHIHHSSNPEITTALNYVDNKIRDNQKIIITEYSLMKWWLTNITLDLSPDFVTAAAASSTDRIYPPPAGITKCWQYVDYALKNPRPLEEWNAFNQYTPWLETRKDYICNSYKIFKSYPKFWFSTYAMRQSYPLNTDFTATTDPWVLNGLFVNRSVEIVSATGAGQGRYSYLAQFADINGPNPTCN